MYSCVKEKSRKGGITAKSLRGCEQKVRAESASRMRRQKVRNWKKRQKLRSGVKEKSGTRENAAETAQRRKETVGYAAKGDRNFTAA